MEKNKKRSTRVDKSLKLSPKQKEICLGTVITDGWFEMGAGSLNPRIGLQLKKDSLDVMEKWKENLSPFAPGAYAPHFSGGTLVRKCLKTPLTLVKDLCNIS